MLDLLDSSELDIDDDQSREDWIEDEMLDRDDAEDDSDDSDEFDVDDDDDAPLLIEELYADEVLDRFDDTELDDSEDADEA